MELYAPKLDRVCPEQFAQSLFEKLSDEREIDASELAQLFALSMRNGPLQQVLQDTLRIWLLGRTLAHAIDTVDFYRVRKEIYQNWMSHCRPGERVPEDLPVLRRSDLQENPSAFISLAGDLELLSHTSGSTGEPVLIHRSRQEVRFVQRYYDCLLEPARVPLKTKPLCLTFPNLYHGSALPLPSIGMPIISGVTDDTLIQDATRILRTSHKIPGCSERIQFLSGLSHHVVFFTNYLLEQGYDVGQFALSGVSITGGYISPHWSAFLRRAWNCPVFDRWSMTELVGGATRDCETGLFLFDPHVFVEVVNPINGHCVTGNGVGELVITTLYPFAQMQPLIRYATGDLVYQTTLSGTETRAYAFLGKLKNCLMHFDEGELGVLVSSAQLYDLLTSWPEVSCYDFFPNIAAVKDRRVGSMPIFRLCRKPQESKTVECRVLVQLRFNPDAFPERRVNLKRELERYVMAAPYTCLAPAVKDKKANLTIDFVGPGAIDSPPIIKV